MSCALNTSGTWDNNGIDTHHLMLTRLYMSCKVFVSPSSMHIYPVARLLAQQTAACIIAQEPSSSYHTVVGNGIPMGGVISLTDIQ